MSILNVQSELEKKLVPQGQAKTKLDPSDLFKGYEVSSYAPNDEERLVRAMILRQFVLSDQIMNKPRVEFNDLSVLQRMQYDQMAFNTYQPNNGEPLAGDILNSWKSNAIRPIVRNKCISIAAHATARLIFPKVFAQDESSDEQQEAATVMEDLMEWAADQSDYSYNAVMRTITAITDPASIGYTEYAEVYRTIKTERGADGKWQTERVLDEHMSGFQNAVVPVNELYIENFYEPDIQKQGYLLWRRVISYSLAETKYKDLYANFQHVRPGVQLIFNDANQSFYQVYDTNMRQDMVEEIIYWNRTLDLKIIMVNGVMLTEPDNPNPRMDKLYPFDKYGYEIINNKCFYYKSLAFKMQQDANIINTLYPMIIDGTYLNMMPPMINIGGETIASDVIVPGAVTTLSDPNSDLKPISLATRGLQEGMNTLAKVEESVSQSSQEPLMQGNQQNGSQTAYEISRLEQNANTVLGLFIKMIGQHVKEFGKLRMGDILQYLTIADVNFVEDNAELVYKTFLIRDRNVDGKQKSRKLRFEKDMPENINADQALEESYKTLEEQDRYDDKVEIWRINPARFRKLKYQTVLSPDVINPKSDELERALNLEVYDRAINNPLVNQENITRDLLFGSYDKTKKNVDKYVIDKSEQPAMAQNPMDQASLNNNASPLDQIAATRNPLPQSAPALKV